MILELRDFILLKHLHIFLGSSVVEQVTVNHLVGGSNPSQGAIFKRWNIVLSFQWSFIAKEREPQMGSTISRSFFFQIYWLRKIGDLRFGLRSSNSSQGAKTPYPKIYNILLSIDFKGLNAILFKQAQNNRLMFLRKINLASLHFMKIFTTVSVL